MCCTAGTLVAVASGSKPIEHIRVGDRELTVDSSGDETNVDKSTWLSVTCTAPNPDGSDDVLEIELLRSPAWLAETGCKIGASIGLAIPEMGLAGWARVMDVKPCPKLQTGAGRVVTMTITHLNAFVLRFKIEGQSEILEPTILHPLHSEDRHEWVHAGELRVGERLRTKTGPARIEAISHNGGRVGGNAKNFSRLSDVNPHPGLKGRMNCVECALANAARLAGRPAIALPNAFGTPKTETQGIMAKNGFVNQEWHVSLDMLTNSLRAKGPGSRAIAIEHSVDGPAHAYNVCNRSGRVIFEDAQTGVRGIRNVPTGGGVFEVYFAP